FRTVQGNATQLVQPGGGKAGSDSAKPIANELVVTLKPGAKIENVPCARDAKITGRIDGLNVYRLRFNGEAETRAAAECLKGDPAVASIDSNFPIDRPPSTQLADNLSAQD